MSPRPTSQISKKPRASKPKVKTGCRTCKRRHVKCDETKPECLRCANFGRKCEGYPSEEDDPPPKPSPPPSSRRLLSKALLNITPSPDLLPARASIESFLPFQDDHEYRYFCVFRDRTSIELAGGFDPSLWRRLVVQACDNTAIRELTTAVAALSLAGKQCPEAAVSRCFHMQDHQNHDVNSHLQYALMQYGSALKRIQRMVANGQDTIRIALIAALLIFVFENLHGDTDRAVKPIQSAIELILKSLSNMPRPYRGARTDPAHLQTPGPIEEELLSAFMRLCGPSLAIIRTKEHITTYLSNQIFTLAYAAGELHIPGGFATISEARLYLEDIRWRVAPSPNSRVPSRQGSPSFPAVSFAPPDFNSMGSPMGSFSKFSTSEELQLNQWHTSFTPLFEYSMTQAGAASFIPAAILYVQGQKDNLVIRHYAERSIPSDPDGELQIIGNILSVSRQLVAQPGFSRGFVFDQGIIPTLVMILMMCSDRDAKWETLDVLQSMIPRREGFWDSRIAAEAAEKMLAQEDGTDWMSNMGFDSRMRNDSLETMSSGEDFNFFNSDLESTSSDRDSIDPRLLGNIELGLDDEMNQMIDPVLRSRTPNMEKVSLRDFLCR